MRRHEFEATLYEMEHGTYAVYGPLFIQLDDTHGYPRILNPSEAFTGVGGTRGEMIRESEPSGTVEVEVIESADYSLYHSTSEYDTLQEALKSPQRGVPTRFFIEEKDAFIEVQGNITVTTVEDMSTARRHPSDDRVTVAYDGRDELVVPKEELDEWIADDRAELLIPLDITERAYARH